MNTPFPLGAKVRFTQDRLSVLTLRDRKGLEGRIGVVQTDGSLVKKPTVFFPAEGARPDLRLFRVEPAQLEIVEMPPEPQAPSPASADASPTPASADASPPPADAGENLSQSDLDKLFD